jgi:biopolymer transport protein ExbD
MRISSKHEDNAEADLTPMIDMTFLLIAFFVMLINFNDAEQNQKIHLPKSEVAKPPESPPDKLIVVHVTSDGTAIFKGNEVDVPDMKSLLIRYKQVHGDVLEVTVIIRGDQDSKTGKVQELIKVCQDEGFEKFALRARYEKDF